MRFLHDGAAAVSTPWLRTPLRHTGDLFEGVARSPAARALHHSTSTSFQSISSAAASLFSCVSSAAGLFHQSAGRASPESFYLQAGFLVLLAVAFIAGTLQLLLMSLRTAATVVLLVATHFEAVFVVLLLAALTALIAARPWSRGSAVASALRAIVQRAGGGHRIASVLVMVMGAAIIMLAAMQFHPADLSTSVTAWPPIAPRGALAVVIARNQAAMYADGDYALLASRLLAYCDTAPPGPSPSAIARLQALSLAAAAYLVDTTADLPAMAANSPTFSAPSPAIIPSHLPFEPSSPPSPAPPHAATPTARASSKLALVMRLAARVACNSITPTEVRMLALPFAAHEPSLLPLIVTFAAAHLAARAWLAVTAASIAVGMAIAGMWAARSRTAASPAKGCHRRQQERVHRRLSLTACSPPLGGRAQGHHTVWSIAGGRASPMHTSAQQQQHHHYPQQQQQHSAGKNPHPFRRASAPDAAIALPAVEAPAARSASASSANPQAAPNAAPAPRAAAGAALAAAGAQRPTHNPPDVTAYVTVAGAAGNAASSKVHVTPAVEPAPIVTALSRQLSRLPALHITAFQLRQAALSAAAAAVAPWQPLLSLVLVPLRLWLAWLWPLQAAAAPLCRASSIGASFLWRTGSSSLATAAWPLTCALGAPPSAMSIGLSAAGVAARVALAVCGWWVRAALWPARLCLACCNALVWRQ